jgi:hypothetical protein
MPTADLEIGLHRRDEGRYAVELRFRGPDAAADQTPAQGLAVFDFEALRQAADRDAYGPLLSRALFADPKVRAQFGTIRAVAQAIDATLRLRLSIGPSAPELHGLRWELLRDPESDERLLTSETVLFSRYLSSFDWRPVQLRPRSDLRALVVVANPADVGRYQPAGRPLAPVDVPGELERARRGLGEIPVTAVTGPETLNHLFEALRDEYDILYLVAHGALIQGEPRLWLEGETGQVAVTAGSELVDRLKELHRRPRLVVLASCQSAGAGEEASADDGGALAALGPRLAEAGIPAVVAMQGRVTMATVARFLPVFFKELRRDGQIDRAMAVARGAVRDRSDHWMPVLFLRLSSGRIWYVPGFSGGGGKSELDCWNGLLHSIQQRRCTPILGSGLLEPFVGTTREIALRWAESDRFPLAPHAREDLPQVAQYLSVTQGDSYPRDTLPERLGQEILRRFGGVLPEAARRAPVSDLLTAAGAKRRGTDPAEPHGVLALLPFPIYLTANPDGLLEAALAEAEPEAEPGAGATKRPVVELCRWNEEVDWPESVYDRQPDFRPTPGSPLVYHLFGRLQEPDSLVLTEDNYFDYLIGLTRNNDLIPEFVRRTLADSALMFLGFRMEEWDFRILFRYIMGQGGERRRKKYAHVAVQLDPEENRTLDQDGARRYLQRFFGGYDISIYWGSVEDFATELKARWLGRHPPGAQGVPP